MITAKEIRKLQKDKKLVDLDDLLKKIRTAAIVSLDKKSYYVEYPLNEAEIDKLIELGFDVYRQDSLTIQKESIYYTISWEEK